MSNNHQDRVITRTKNRIEELEGFLEEKGNLIIQTKDEIKTIKESIQELVNFLTQQKKDDN